MENAAPEPHLGTRAAPSPESPSSVFRGLTEAQAVVGRMPAYSPAENSAASRPTAAATGETTVSVRKKTSHRADAFDVTTNHRDGGIGIAKRGDDMPATLANPLSETPDTFAAQVRVTGFESWAAGGGHTLATHPPPNSRECV